MGGSPSCSGAADAGERLKNGDLRERQQQEPGEAGGGTGEAGRKHSSCLTLRLEQVRHKSFTSLLSGRSHDPPSLWKSSQLPKVKPLAGEGSLHPWSLHMEVSL